MFADSFKVRFNWLRSNSGSHGSAFGAEGMEVMLMKNEDAGCSQETSLIFI